MSLIGDLSEIKIADVMRLFAQGKKSGRLMVTGTEEQAVVHFHKGAVIHAHSSQLQGDEAILDLFGWTQGQLTFIVDEKSVTPNVKRSVDQLILEGVRVGETVHRIHALIPSDQVVFRFGPGPADPAARVPIGPRQWRVLRLVDGSRPVRELLAQTGMSRTELLPLLFELAEAGLIEKVEAPRRTPPRPAR